MPVCLAAPEKYVGYGIDGKLEWDLRSVESHLIVLEEGGSFI